MLARYSFSSGVGNSPTFNWLIDSSRNGSSSLRELRVAQQVIDVV